MKTIIKSIMILIVTSLFLTSCNQDDLNLDNEANVLDIDSAVKQTEIDNISEGLNDIGDDIFLAYENSAAAKSSDTKNDFEGIQLPECLTVTKEITNSSIIVTLDYGEGCFNRNDNFLSGKIRMIIGYDGAEKAVSIDYTFENFYFNNKKVEGEIHKTKIRKNENGFPQAIIIKDIKITWEDGVFVTVKGERKREWIEGFDNKFWGDNVFSVTGAWKVTQRDGTTITANITTPLIRKAACRFIVSGVVEINRNNNKIIIDYGDGECDNLAIANRNGKEYEIQLGKKRK